MTLACGEAELQVCKEAIAEQEYVHVEHLVFEGYSELEGHKHLFGAWNKKRHEFDLFVKIDADTILEHPKALFQLWCYFRDNSDLTAVQTGLLDYFTNTMIAGLNSFSSDVTFSMPNDTLYCDRISENGHRKVLKPNDTLEIYPIARHCVAPHDKQSFHYGYRRWMKGQTDIIKNCLVAWQEIGGDGRFWALIGAREAYMFRLKDASYDNETFMTLFDNAKQNINTNKFSITQIERDINGMIKSSLRMQLQRILYNSRIMFKQFIFSIIRKH